MSQNPVFRTLNNVRQPEFQLSAPPSPVNPLSPSFSTERLQLAIYLHASQRLPFLGCEAGANGKVRFAFDDASGIGPQVELEFDRGAEVAASDLFASQKYLRRKMSEALNKRRI
jgi:hypothetical protein